VATDAMPLTMLPPHRPARVVSIRAGHTLTERLAGLGLRPGAEVSVLHDNGGPLLLAVGETRVALGRGMAHKVLVTPLPQGETVLP